MNTVTLCLPIWMAPALINGDLTGYSDKEEAEINDLESWLAAEHGVIGPCLSVDNEDLFRWRNDWNNLGGAVADFTFPCD